MGAYWQANPLLQARPCTPRGRHCRTRLLGSQWHICQRLRIVRAANATKRTIAPPQLGHGLEHSAPTTIDPLLTTRAGSRRVDGSHCAKRNRNERRRRKARRLQRSAAFACSTNSPQTSSKPLQAAKLSAPASARSCFARHPREKHRHAASTPQQRRHRSPSMLVAAAFRGHAQMTTAQNSSAGCTARWRSTKSQPLPCRRPPAGPLPWPRSTPSRRGRDTKKGA